MNYNIDKHTVKEILRQIVDGNIKESTNNLNFRCPLCGDSKKTKAKKRGWVYFDVDSVMFHCYNCNEHMSLVRLLKNHYPALYKQYIKQRNVKAILQIGKSEISVSKEKSRIKEHSDISDEFNAYSFGLFDKNLDKKYLMLQYLAVKYALSRKIPKSFIKKMRVAYDGKFQDRVLIPYYDADDNIYCFQGRSLTGREPKYLTNKPEGNTKIFNFFTVDPSRLVLITEGPIDALFLDNAIATSGIVNYGTDQFKEILQKFSNRTWVFDNDETGRMTAMDYAGKGEYVFCWPVEFSDIKDINELILKKDLTDKEIYGIINENTFTRFKALIKLKIRRN